jgi:hypothetical protein
MIKTRTVEGRNRIAQSNTVHSHETRKARSDRSIGMARLAELEELGCAIGLLTGPRSRGPKPNGRRPTLRMCAFVVRLLAPGFEFRFAKG